MRQLSVDQPIYGLQASGIAAEAPFPASIEEIADDYVTVMRGVRPTGPYHLLGWSFGGIIAHTVACRLQQEHEDVVLLAILDSFPPSDEVPAFNYQDLLENMIEFAELNLERLDGEPINLDTIIEAARRQGHTMGALEVEQAERMLRLRMIL
jgi:thioesterase domain-containing protein